MSPSAIRTLCPFCGYHFEGLPASQRIRCPECGRRCGRVDVALANLVVPLWWPISLLLSPVVVLGAATAAYSVSGGSLLWPSFAGLAAGFAWNLVSERKAKVLGGRYGDPARRTVMIWCGAVLMSGLLTLGMGLPPLMFALVILFGR